jgi:hypothetical protein
VRAPQRRVEGAGGRRDPCPVQAGVAVGSRLGVDQAADGLKRQAGRRDAGDVVAAQDRVGVLVAAGLCVRVVGIDGARRARGARAGSIPGGRALVSSAGSSAAVGGRRRFLVPVARAGRGRRPPAQIPLRRTGARGRRRGRRPRWIRASFSIVRSVGSAVTLPARGRSTRAGVCRRAPGARDPAAHCGQARRATRRRPARV